MASDATSSAHSAAASLPEVEPLEKETMRLVARRLIPLLMAGYFAAFLDRVNVGFAALTMNKALGFSAEIYGIGSGAMSLARVMIPLALFGTRNYGRASGILAAFQNVAFALAPLVYAALFARAGTSVVLWLSFVAGMVSLLGLTTLNYLRLRA